MLIIPYFRDGVIIRADDLERLKIYSHDLAVAVASTSTPGVLYGLTILRNGNVFKLLPGAARLNSGEIVVVDSTDSITIPVSTVTSSLSQQVPATCPLYLYKSGTSTVSSRANLVNAAQIVATKDTLSLTTSLPTTVDSVLIGVLTVITQGNYSFTRNPATIVNTHTNQWVNGAYTGPQLHGTNAIVPLSITNPSIAGRTIEEEKIKDRTLVRRNINQAYGLVWPGTIMNYAGTNLQDFSPIGGTIGPTISGWRICDGTALPIPVSESDPYVKLYNAIGTTYGGSGGYFNLPDLRGVFVRGYDSTTGSARRDEPGRAFGSYQSDLIKRHSHRIPNKTDLTPKAVDSIGPEWGGYNWDAPQAGVFSDDGTRTGQQDLGSETRPKNIAMHYIIYTGEYYLA